MHRLWLIARREIVAYTGVASFWVALVLGPVLMLVTAAMTASATPHPQASAVRVVAADAALADAATRALADAGLHTVSLSETATGPIVIIDGAVASGRAHARIEGDLSRATAALIDRELRLTMQRSLLAEAPDDVKARLGAIEVSVEPPSVASRLAIPADRLGRFGLAMMLWLTLVGALGMLLQAIVRERTQRALESLMSATRPVEIVGGKLLGVGLVSIVVLAAWLAAGAAAAPLAGGSGSAFASALMSTAFGNPGQLARSLLVYVLAFAMYGSVLLAVGAFARDVASAQNMSRPVFGVLLLVFFAALSQLGASGSLPPAMVWAPPMTPFALLMAAPGSLSPVEIVGGIMVMTLGAILGVTAAARLLVAQLDGAPPRSLRRAFSAA